MNSDDPNVILKGVYDSFKELVVGKVNKGGALETLKDIVKGGIQMAMASLLNQAGRPGIIYSNSLLSNAPIGMWHLTIGHPMNPILTMGDLLCTGVDVTFPDDSLSLGDFPTSVKAVVKLKPAKPRDRAGIEMMFNHGQKRIYMPAIIKVVKDQSFNDTKRGAWDTYVQGTLDKVTVPVVEKGGRKIVEETVGITRKATNAISDSYLELEKYIQDKINPGQVWVNVNGESKNKDLVKKVN